MVQEQFDGVVINELRRFEEALTAAGKALRGRQQLGLSRLPLWQ